MELYPLFPLELVVFPLEKLNLHIFEPRYKQLVQDCAESGSLFGIPCYRRDEPMNYGSLVRLVRIEKKYVDGRMDIRTVGVCVFRLNQFLETHPNKLYPGGHIEKMELDLASEMVLRQEIKDKLLELYESMNIKAIPEALRKDEYFTFEIVHKAGLNRDQEYEFLQINTEIKRQEYLLTHLDRLIPIAKNMEEMRRKIQKNGHFKDVLPPKV